MDMTGGGCWQGCGGRVGMCFSCKKNEGYSDSVDTVFEHGERSQKVILSSLRQLFVRVDITRRLNELLFTSNFLLYVAVLISF